MYKESMNAQTILFKGDSFCKAYDLSYLNNNYNKIAKYLQNVKDIYYKRNSSRSSWINYKQALLKPENKGLSFGERIILGAKNDKLSDRLEEIPETEYIDRGGFKYRIGARDGLDSASDLRTLHAILQMNITKKLIPAENDNDCNKIIVNFRTDVSNAIITFNGLFEPYEAYKGSNNTVIYYEDLSRDVEGGKKFEFPRNDKGEIMLDWCHIMPYSWEDVLIDEKFNSIRRQGDWFEFEHEVDSACLLFYNKVMYFFEVNPHNSKLVRILDLDIGNINNFVKEDVQVVRMRDKDGEKLKQQRLVGFYNESEKVVYFPSNITNAIITYNGTRHEYIIRPDKKSIIFKIPADINMYFEPGLDTNSRIYASCFYTGTLDGRSFYQMPNGELSRIANDILAEYKAKLDLSEQHIRSLERILQDDNGNEIIYSGYEETLHETKDIINYPNNQVFILKFKPIEGTLRLYINGVYYNRDVFYTYDKDNKKIIWTYGVDANFNGFDIDDTMIVTVKYDIYYKDNADIITDIPAFKYANK